MSGFAAGIAQGLSSGLRTGYGMASDIQKNNIEAEKNDRDRERYDQEKKDREERAAFAEEVKKLKDDRANGRGAFEGFLAPGQAQKRSAVDAQVRGEDYYPGSSQQGISTQQSAAPAATGLRTPAEEAADDQKIFEATGVRPVARQEPAAASTAAPAGKSPLFDGGEGLYRNQKAVDDLYYDQLASLYENHYLKLGQADKAATIRESLLDLKDKGYERARKKVFADLFSGNPVGVAGLSKIYDTRDDGYRIDPNSGAFDGKTGTWKGVTFVDGQGNKKSMDLDRPMLERMYLASDPTKLIDYNFKERDEARKEKETEGRVNYWEDSTANKKEEIRVRGEELKTIKGAQAAARWSSAQGNVLGQMGTLYAVNKSLTPDKLAMMPQDQRNAEISKTSKASLAYDVWSLNANHDAMREGISPALAKRLTDDMLAGRLDTSKMSQNEDGTISYMLGNRKVILPPPRPKQ